MNISAVPHVADNTTDPVMKHKVVIFDTELEKQIEYDYLQDWAETIPINRKSDHKNKNAKQSNIETYSSLKCFLKIDQCMAMINDESGKMFDDSSISNKYTEFIKMNTETNVTIRVYLVQGLNLRSHDLLNSSDTYARIEYGNQKVWTTQSY